MVFFRAEFLTGIKKCKVGVSSYCEKFRRLVMMHIEKFYGTIKKDTKGHESELLRSIWNLKKAVKKDPLRIGEEP